MTRIAKLVVGRKLWLSFFCVVSAARVNACPDESVLVEIAGIKNLFIGEMHGTEETPSFVKCVVDKKLELEGEGIVVSLEIPGSVTTSSEFWDRDAHIQDGRSSQAMYRLYLYLQSKARQGVLDLRFLENTNVGALADDPKNHGVVIYRGNAHSRRSASNRSGAAVGEAAGDGFTSLFVVAGDGGEFWGCTAEFCGVHPYAALNANTAVPHGSLVDGSIFDHDYLYLLESRVFTASPPVERNPVCLACIEPYPQ